MGEREILHENLTGRILLYRISRLLKGVRAGDTVVAVSISRLGRSIGMLTLVLETIFAKGAQGLTPREIAGQLGVSRGTVVNYLKSKGL